jgi:hypothetical protein
MITIKILSSIATELKLTDEDDSYNGKEHRALFLYGDLIAKFDIHPKYRDPRLTVPSYTDCATEADLIGQWHQALCEEFKDVLKQGEYIEIKEMGAELLNEYKENINLEYPTEYNPFSATQLNLEIKPMVYYKGFDHYKDGHGVRHTVLGNTIKQ